MNPEEHAAHMTMVEEGLKAIMASEDINEIKQIAQSLLGEEKKEEASEGSSPEETMKAGLQEGLEKGGY